MVHGRNSILGIAEAVIKGEIVDFKIINEGDGLPSDSSVFLDNLNSVEASGILEIRSNCWLSRR